MGSEISPRLGVLLRLWAGHTFRASYNRAFRAPTVTENFAELPSAQVITVPTPPFTLSGNQELDAERLDAFEVAWIGDLGRRTRLSVALYRNDLEGYIRVVPSGFYSSADPPPGWPLDPGLLDVPPPGGCAGIPSAFEYENIGGLVNRGVEVAFDLVPAAEWTLGLSYSWQDDPEVDDLPPLPLPNGSARVPVNMPPRHRLNANMSWDGKRFYVNGSVSYQDEAFWTDVLGPAFWGPTEQFVVVTVGTGFRVDGDRVVVHLDAQNLLDADVQQHVWGDVLGRKVTTGVRFRF